jgi:hypothetical protein
VCAVFLREHPAIVVDEEISRKAEVPGHMIAGQWPVLAHHSADGRKPSAGVQQGTW